MEFKDKLKELRKQKGISQETLAAEILTSRSTVAKWENGLSLPNLQSLELLANYFKVDQKDLLVNGTAEETIVTKNRTISKMQKLCIVFSIVLGVLFVFAGVIFILYLIGLKKSETYIPPANEHYGYVVEILGYESETLKEQGEIYTVITRLDRDTVFRFTNTATQTVVAKENVHFENVAFYYLAPSGYFLLSDDSYVVIDLWENEDGTVQVLVRQFPEYDDSSNEESEN